MKKSMILILAVIVSVNCKAQTKPDYVFSDTTPVKIAARLNPNSDTLTILSSDIKVIVIDGMSYNIIRSAKTKNDDSSEFIHAMRIDEIRCVRITIEGLKEVRHDALCRLKFSYAHELKLEIIKEKALLSKLQNN